MSEDSVVPADTVVLDLAVGTAVSALQIAVAHCCRRGGHLVRLLR